MGHPSILDTIANGKQCPDNKQFCTMFLKTDGGKFGIDNLIYTFDQKRPDATIPKGYFCLNTY
jgi:hypothetical protein